MIFNTPANNMGILLLCGGVIVLCGGPASGFAYGTIKYPPCLKALSAEHKGNGDTRI